MSGRVFQPRKTIMRDSPCCCNTCVVDFIQSRLGIPDYIAITSQGKGDPLLEEESLG